MGSLREKNVSVAPGYKPLVPTGVARTQKTGAKRKRTAHDSGFPQAYVDFMLQGWSKGPAADSRPLPNLKYHRARRRKLSAAFPDDLLVIPTGNERVRANDTFYRFRPGSDFFYLTGNHEPDSVLLMVPSRSGHIDTLFVWGDSGRSDTSFFADRDHGALWVGATLSLQASRRRFGVKRCASLKELPEYLKRHRPKRGCVRVLRGLDQKTERQVRSRKPDDHALAQWLSEARMCKDVSEIEALKDAGRSSRKAFDDLVRAIPAARSERDLEVAFEARARRIGNGVGYNTIAAAGANACVLHWHHNNALLKKSELVLIDAGVEGPQLYTADVTRTLPMRGRFNRVQRRVYDIVRNAQKAAIRAVRPGAMFLDPHRAAMEVLAHGLEELGVIKNAHVALEPDKQFYRRYTLHGTSHMLGIDVHDCPHASDAVYRNGLLKPGMVLTVEPGLYFQPDDSTVPKNLRGIGIRIEDDVLVTAKGRQILTPVPRDAHDIEAWMADLWS